MSKGIIFNIQKFSTNDGPGVRTTVFLKGCPLKCRWCANPESQSAAVQILHDQNRCIRCSACAGCLQCVHDCPQEALSYEGEYRTVQEVVHICLQDRDFYETSGGGVTISGGEGMAQPEFLEELLTELKRHGIHLAIETTGYAKPEVFQRKQVP